MISKSVLLAGVMLASVSAAFAGQAPGALSAADIPISHHDRVYAADQTSNTVSVIDTASNTVTATVAVGANPFWLAITPNGRRAYVANGGEDTVSVIHLANNEVIANIPVGRFNGPFGVAITLAPRTPLPAVQCRAFSFASPRPSRGRPSPGRPTASG